MTMGEYIRALRKDAGLTQEELGAKLSPKVNRAAINKWESGYVENIKRNYIEQMSILFDVRPCELMCFESKKEEPEELHILSTPEKHLLDTFRILDNADQTDVIWYADKRAEAEKYQKKKLKEA